MEQTGRYARKLPHHEGFLQKGVRIGGLQSEEMEERVEGLDNAKAPSNTRLERKTSRGPNRGFPPPIQHSKATDRIHTTATKNTSHVNVAFEKDDNVSGVPSDDDQRQVAPGFQERGDGRKAAVAPLSGAGKEMEMVNVKVQPVPAHASAMAGENRKMGRLDEISHSRTAATRNQLPFTTVEQMVQLQDSESWTSSKGSLHTGPSLQTSPTPSAERVPETMPPRQPTPTRRYLPTILARNGSSTKSEVRKPPLSPSAISHIDPSLSIRDDNDLVPAKDVWSRSYSLRVPASQSPKPFVRSQSMRQPPGKGKPRKLLRDLSFSDAEGKLSQDYGALAGATTLPKRGSSLGGDSISEDDESANGILEVQPHLLRLMKELLQRGKVRKVAVLDKEGGHILASLPQWPLEPTDQLGLVKAIICTKQIMLKLSIDREVYTCLKHGQNKMVGRAGDNVLVAHDTAAYVVVAMSSDNTPGSCLYEVAEFADALTDKGW